MIVPTYNNEQIIERCVESLLAIEYPEKEIIFVDDGSTDGTVEVIRKMGGNVIEIEHGGPAKARNVGVKNSTGDIVVFLDSDCIVRPRWLWGFVDRFTDDIGVVGGSLKPASLDRVSEVFEQYRRDRLYGKKEKIIKVLPSCNMGVKREVLDAVGGFDEDFKYASTEDYDLCLRIVDKGYKILFVPCIEVLHMHSQTWGGVFNRAYIHGHEGVLLRKKRGVGVLKEVVGMGKIVILPLISLKNWGEMQSIGLIYEIYAWWGRLRGVIDYYMKEV